jgi:hypothetical protein
MSTDYIALATEALTAEGPDAYFGATSTSWPRSCGTPHAVDLRRGRLDHSAGVRRRPALMDGAVMPLSLTDADLDAIRQVVAEEISRNNVALHGDLDDPTDGPLDQAALRRHGDAVDLVRQDTQDHCMACGHKGEVAS